MTKEEMVETMAEVARRAGMNVNAWHPSDVAIAMSMAVETAGETLAVLEERT